LLTGAFAGGYTGEREEREDEDEKFIRETEELCAHSMNGRNG
jgi:uncharacterized protein YcfJ